MGFEVLVSDRVEVNRRVTYDLLGWLANIGGLHKWIMITGRFIVTQYASVYMLGLIANRFYTWSPPNYFKRAAGDTDTDEDDNDKQQEQREGKVIDVDRIAG